MAKSKTYYFVAIDSPHIHHFDEEWCYSESYIRDVMEDEEIEEITVYRAQREKNADSFYCHEYGQVGLKSETECGKSCQGYAPRNGRSGICKHHSNTWESTDEAVTLRKSDPRQRRLIKRQPQSVTLSGVEGQQTPTKTDESHG
jgi:hypothetical protein